MKKYGWLVAASGCIIVVILALYLTSQINSSPITYDTLDEYYSTIDYSCNTDSDCIIQDIRNCCGYYPQCTNKNAKTDVQFVNDRCSRQQLGGVCGFPTVESCTCVQNKCQGKPN